MSQKIKNATIGTDAELFLASTENEIISAEGIIPGTKHEPFQFSERNRYFAVSLDNILAEFCIPPSKSESEWLQNIKTSMDYVNFLASKENCKAVAVPAARVDKKYLQTPNARLFGCESDYNVWIRAVNPKPKAAGNLRSGGFHVHLGYEQPETSVTEAWIKTMDLFVGVPSVLQEPSNERKSLYGKAGAFRFKDYGAEYRTISNYILQSEELTKWIFRATQNAIDFVNAHDVTILDEYMEQIVDAINNNNSLTAQTLINQFNLELV
jgi:hypothetical protein